jgi:uncharacterized protein YprB with RNaseH-like and TPR domain
MLKSTFLHIPSVGNLTEGKLWKNNILSWQDFMDDIDSVPLPSLKKERINEGISRSFVEYDRENVAFFSSTLPPSQHWRVYPDFKRRCFLDIETTGLSSYSNEITLIGIYDGKDTKTFVNGKNLDEFKTEVGKYSTILTFNGRSFDIPFIRAKFPGLCLNQFHIDLRQVLRALGYKGGLKHIEHELGISRDEEIRGIDGFEAVRLWHRYRRGDTSALELLKEYNEADIKNLKTLIEFAFPRLKEKIFDKHLSGNGTQVGL